LLDLNEILILLTDFSKRIQIANFVDQSRGSLDVSCWRKDGRRDGEIWPT